MRSLPLEPTDFQQLLVGQGMLERVPGQVQRLERFLLGAVESADAVVQFGVLELREEMPPVEANRRFQRVHGFVDVVVDGMRHSQAGSQVY